jgi:putative polyhydroxyalkanoate system protein
MAVIGVKRSHALGKEAARHGVQQVAEKLQDELKAKCHWEGDSLIFACPGADGRITVDDSEVAVKVHLSWLLSPLHGRIEASIRGYLDEYLGVS